MQAYWPLGPFEKVDAANPCLGPQAETIFDCPLAGPVAWEAKDVFNPAAVVRDGKVCLLYRAEDTVGRFLGTSRIGLATSDDGLHFTRRAAPVLYPDHDAQQAIEWEGGCEDPRVVERAEGGYVLTYTAFDGSVARLCVATSDDLVHWRKHGPAFGETGARWWSKSGAIVCRRMGDRLVATRINGRYWMYFGESNLYVATSDDLIAWTPLLTTLPMEHRIVVSGASYAIETEVAPSVPLAVLRPRAGRFDSALVEPGPPAILTERGIVLIYNSANAGATGDSMLPPRAYSPGQALFDPADPTALIWRCDAPFLNADRPYEIAGQVNHVVFVEGIVPFGGRWLLYYGTADSLIAVAQGPAIDE
ncbi:MAG TPA: glycoside hydrolase family 130 protein [Caldilinea sp.]|nr:glycoside hydrolase family 130 protein [Caldilinea sp.]